MNDDDPVYTHYYLQKHQNCESNNLHATQQQQQVAMLMCNFGQTVANESKYDYSNSAWTGQNHSKMTFAFKVINYVKF